MLGVIERRGEEVYGCDGILICDSGSGSRTEFVAVILLLGYCFCEVHLQDCHGGIFDGLTKSTSGSSLFPVSFWSAIVGGPHLCLA